MRNEGELAAGRRWHLRWSWCSPALTLIKLQAVEGVGEGSSGSGELGREAGRQKGRRVLIRTD